MTRAEVATEELPYMSWDTVEDHRSQSWMDVSVRSPPLQARDCITPNSADNSSATELPLCKCIWNSRALSLPVSRKQDTAVSHRDGMEISPASDEPNSTDRREEVRTVSCVALPEEWEMAPTGHCPCWPWLRAQLTASFGPPQGRNVMTCDRLTQ